MAVTRRALLGAGAGVAGAGALGVGGLQAATYQGLLPELAGRPGVRFRVGYWLGLDGDEVPYPDDPAGPVIEPEPFRSPHRPDGPEPWAYSLPPGHTDMKGLPVVVVLHGWGDDHRFCFDTLGMQHFQARVIAEGRRPFVVASPDGQKGWWHPRADGTDWARLVSDGLLGELARLGADTSRLGLLGWSMGAQGALRLAEMELYKKVAAVGAMSTAIYPSWDVSPHEDAFDGPEDFARNSPTLYLDRLRGVPAHVACGVNDTYIDMSHWLARQLDPAPEELYRKGDHSADFWRLASPSQLRFIADRL